MIAEEYNGSTLITTLYEHQVMGAKVACIGP